MSASTNNGFFSGLSRFFTMKSDSEIRQDERQASKRAAVIAEPHGIRGFLKAEQDRIDALKGNTDQFLADIERHFGAAQKYLGENYDGKTKYENVETGRRRRFAIKWEQRDPESGEPKAEVAFVYTETPKGVRIDYIGKHGADFEEVANEEFEDSGEVKMLRSRISDSFRTIHRFENHAQFLSEGKMPTWFVEMLGTHIPPI